jgi:hypothetical protein
MAATVNYFEVSGPKQAGLADFYAGVFGWKLAGEPDYLMVTPGREGAIDGGLWDAASGWTEPDTSYAVFYVEVPDVRAAIAAAEAKGAKVLIGARDHGPTIAAHLIDPAGNRFGIYQNREQ